MGGGVGLSLHGRYRIATEKTLFAMPETAIGFFPDIGASYPLARLDGKLGLYLALTGARLKGKEVFDTGIATHYVTSDKLGELNEQLIKLNKPNSQQIDNLLSKFSIEHKLGQYSLDKINSIFNSNSVEEIISKLKNDNSEWSNKQLNLLNKMSPTSLKVTFVQLALAKNLNLNQVLKLDYQLCQRFIISNDFSEGVRALLVDKDNKPQWMPKKLEDVGSDIIDWYINPITNDDIFRLDDDSTTVSNL